MLKAKILKVPLFWRQKELRLGEAEGGRQEIAMNKRNTSHPRSGSGEVRQKMLGQF
jgi:hypothetical protein